MSWDDVGRAAGNRAAGVAISGVAVAAGVGGLIGVLAARLISRLRSE